MAQRHNITDDYLNSFPFADLVEGKVIADIGPGDGYATRKFLNAGAEHVYPNDIDFTNFDKELESDPRVTCLKNDLSVFAPSLQFDIVWCHHCLEHVNDPYGFLKNIATRLNPESASCWLWLGVPNMAQTPIFSTGHIHNFTAPSLIALLRRAGYDVSNASIWAVNGQLRIRVQPHNCTPYPAPMLAALKETGRCHPDVIANYNW